MTLRYIRFLKYNKLKDVHLLLELSFNFITLLLLNPIILYFYDIVGNKHYSWFCKKGRYGYCFIDVNGLGTKSLFNTKLIFIEISLKGVL